MGGRNTPTVFPALTRWSGQEFLPGVSSTQGEEQDEEAAEAAERAVMEALEMARGKGLLPSPTELHLDTAKPCATLPPLRWHHWGHQPHKMRLTNTGCTVMVSAKWRAKVRAHLTGGPLLGRYVFSQLHFHWGQQDTEGSEHTLQGDSFPLEMHMVLFKSRYLTQEAALKEMDGVVEVAYFFQLAKKDNPHLEPMIQALPKVACAMKSTRFGPLPLSELVPSFPTDYLLYMGSLLTGKCAHALTWIVRYQPLSISKRQLEALRSVYGLDGNPLLRNWRKAHPPMGRTVLHVVPPGTKKSLKGDQFSEGVPAEKRQTRFSPDWTENEQEAPPDAEPDRPKSGRRFFGCFGKNKNQDAAEEKASLLTIDSSGDSETTDTSISQPWLPRIASQHSQRHPEVTDSMFRAMCEASHVPLTSSSSQQSSTAGEGDHDSSQETAAVGDVGRRRDIAKAAKRKHSGMGLMQLQLPELRGNVGDAFFKPPERRRSVGLVLLDQRGHRRAVIRSFNPLLSEVEEESDRTSEAVTDAADGENGCAVADPEEYALLDRPLRPLKSPLSVMEEEKERSSMNDENVEARGNGDARLCVELNTCPLTLSLSPSGPLIVGPSSPIDEGTETSLFTAVNEDSLGSVEIDDRELSYNGDRCVTSVCCQLTESAQRVENSSPTIPNFHRYSKGGISWWAPFTDTRDFTSDDNSNDPEGSSVAQNYPVDNFSVIAKTIVDNCICVLGEEMFTDTSTTTDTRKTAITDDQRCTDLLSVSTITLSSKESVAQQSPEEQDTLDTIWRSQIPDNGFKGMKNIGSLSLSDHEETCSKNADCRATSEIHSDSLYPDAATNVSVHPEDTYQTNHSDVSYTWSTRSRGQKRFDEEELRFPEIRIPKRNNHKQKVGKKRTSLSMSTLHDLEENNYGHSVFQRATKDGKIKDRLNSWREMQSRKRSSRKSEKKKHNRSKRRHHSSSSMDHLLHDSSSEHRSAMEKKASKNIKVPATAKKSDTVFADGKSTKDGYECRLRERSNSSTSLSSIFSSSGAKCIEKVIDTGGIQELIGSGNEMQLQEISFHYVPCRTGTAPLNRKHLFTAAHHGDNAFDKSPSKLRLHLKAPVDVSQLLKKVPTGSYITIDSPGAYVPEREVTVGMVLVDNLRSEDGRGTNSSSAQEIPSVMAPHTNREQAEDTPIGDSQDLSILAPEDCGADEHTSANQLQSDVDNVGTHLMETSEVTTTDLSTTNNHSPHKDRCCNGECWICQLSTIKVIQYTQGLDSCGDLPNPENSENVVDTPDAVKSAVNEDEITASANVPTNMVQGVSSVVSRTSGTAQYSGSNERLPLPEPTPIGDVPLQEYHIEDIALPSTQNEVTVLESRESWSTNPTLYRTTMLLRLYPDGNRLSGNNSSSSCGGERMNESSGTSKEAVSEEQKPPQMAVYDANSSHCPETSKTAPLPTVDDESKRDDVGKMSTEVIDIFRKYKRRSQRRNKLSMEGIHETRIMDGLNSYTGCATDSDVSLIPDEDEGVPESANTQSLASGEDILTSENQGTECTGTSEEGGRNSLSCGDGKSTLKRFRLEYDILSKVMLYATLRQLEMNSTSVPRTAGVQPCAQNKICGGNGPNYMGDAFQPSLDMEVVRSLMQIQNSRHKYTSTKSTWTGPEEINTSTTEHSASPQALPVTHEEVSSRETEDTKERQQSVPDADGGTIEANSSNTQLLTVTSKPEKNSSMLCTKGSVARDDRTSNAVEEKTCNDMEGESIADSQDMRDLEAIDLSSSSVSSNATKSQRSNNAETHKTASVEGSVKQQKLCSVEVRNKVHHPGGEPQQRNRPKRPQTRDRILSAREVYERRKTYAKNLALRRTQRTKFCGGSEDGEIRSTLDENQSASEEKSAGESSHKEYPSRNKKSVDEYQSADSVKRIEAGNESVSSSKETTVKNLKHTTDKPHTENKARAGTRTEALRAGKGESSCSTSSTKNKSAASSVKDRTVYGNRSLRSDSKLPGARERSVRTNVIGQQRRGPVKEVDKESANIGRSSASSDHSGGASGTKRTPGSIAASATNRRKLFGMHGHGLKSTTVNDSAVRAPTPSKQRDLTEKQSNRHLDSKSSLLKSVELDCLEIIDKPSLCESWVKQHYSDSTLGSICGSSSAETTVQTIIHSTNKSGTELKVSRNPAVSSEKTITDNESRERLNRKVRGGSEGKASTPPNQQTSLPSEKRKVSRQTDEEKILPSGDSDRLMISFRTDTIPLLTYKPQKLSSDDLKSPHSAHSRESCSEKRSQLLLDSLHTQTAGLPSSQTDVGDVRKIAELLGSKLDEDTRSNLHLPEMNGSTENVTETRELRRTLSYGNKTTATQSSPPSVPDRKSVATSPMPLRKHSRQMSLTVEAFSFCSTGVNTSLSVSRLSSHSLGVQCPSQAISKRPSATAGLLQSIIEAEVKPETHVYAATGMHAMLTEVATKLENQLLVQRSVATQWMRRASVPNLALKSPGPKVKKTGKRKKRDSSNKGQGATSPQPQLVEYDLGLNEVQMENVRALHKRRLFRAFSTNSLALGTNEESSKKIMRRLFRKKKKKKQKSDSTEGKSKGDKKKKKKQEEEQSQDSATVSGSGGAHSPTTAEVANRGDDVMEATTDRSNKSSRSHFDNLSDATGGLRKNLQLKLKEAVQKAVSPRMLLLRGAETAQNPALFEDLEGGSNWCSVHDRAPEDRAGQGGAEADADEVSAAVAQVNTGAHVLRVSLADEESTGCSDLGSMEFVVGGAGAGRQPMPTPSVLARLRQMLTWRS